MTILARSYKDDLTNPEEWDIEPPKTCDKKTRQGRCNKPAYVEVYWLRDGKRHWSYLCKKHYYLDRIKNFIFRWRNWYCDLDD